MTRKDFRVIAAEIASMVNRDEAQAMATRMADVCRQSNPRFDYGRFYAACGL